MTTITLRVDEETAEEMLAFLGRTSKRSLTGQVLLHVVNGNIEGADYVTYTRKRPKDSTKHASLK